MNAFETELGVMPEIAEAVNNMGWLLPTDIQGEAIPLILGGGDVLMAAETGSGKTGAFCLPVIQIVYETLRDIQEQKVLPKSTGISLSGTGFKMSAYDRTPAMAIDPEGLLCQSRDENKWHGCRSIKGLINKGKYYFEAKIIYEGLCRVGWSTQDAVLDLGTDQLGFGYGGTGKKSNSKNFENYGKEYGKDDVIGCFLDLNLMKIKWSKNGEDLGNGFDIPTNLKNQAFFPTICMKNSEIRLNFGEKVFDFPPGDEFIGVSKALKEFTIVSPKSSGIRHEFKRKNNAPLALIIEPSKELAEQTFREIQNFKKYIKNLEINEALIVGGLPMKDQTSQIENGVDIVVATPGRLEDMIETNILSLSQVKFFILDEVDGLLTQGHTNLVMNIHSKIPIVGFDGKRLQMIVCSATLHNFEVKKLAEKLMHFPNWIDLKGLDSVPDTIHHCVCIIDPKKDTNWRSLREKIKTDGVHATDRLNYQTESKEMLSEAVKLLKFDYCVRAIEKYKMDKALIFCRTKLDCDNLEEYFKKMGGGPRATNHQFSCVCLHSDKSHKERTENLEKFRQNKTRFLICTDVAARGIDITELPYVINLTLPDQKQNYVHRIGRVGRADRMGLAISLVSKVHEKVWYHSCQSRGKSCFNRLLKDDGGCCIWYNEMFYLEEIEEHLGLTIAQIPPSLEIPVNEFDGKVVYGEKKQSKTSQLKGHVDLLEPSLRELIDLEKKTQLNYLKMKFFS